MKPYTLVVTVLVGAKLFIHIYVLLFEGYGIFRDELYYIANTDHPAFGYVDHPPLSIWLLDGFTAIFGDHWRMIRVLPALIGGASMYVLIQLTRSLGGNVVACWLAGIAFLFAPINLAFASYYSMNSLEILFWGLAFLALLRSLREPEVTVNWIILGIIVGLGLMNKISMAWFAIGMGAFLLVSPMRHLLRAKGPWIAGASAALLFLPFVIWNVTHDMAHLEFAANASAYKYAGISRTDFLTEQLLMEHPLVLIYLIGAFLLLRSTTSWIQRAPVLIFVITLVILLVKGQVKANYMAPAYLAVFSSGAIWLSVVVKRVWQRALLAGFAVLYVISGLILLPLSTPILPEEDFITYNKALGIGPSNAESKEEGTMPQFFADMHGWENFAATISKAYTALPPDEQARAVAWVNNYGEAAAIDYYRDSYPLPPVLSRHNAYFHWGNDLLDQRSFEVLLIVGGSPQDHEQSLRSVRQVETIRCDYCMPYENNLPVYIGKETKENISLKKIFQAEKDYN